MILVFLLIAMILTGIVLESVLPPGTGGLHRYGQGSGRGWGRHQTQLDTDRSATQPSTFLSLRRHDWGEIHFALAIAFVICIILHLSLNWAWIRCTYFSSPQSEATVNQSGKE